MHVPKLRMKGYTHDWKEKDFSTHAKPYFVSNKLIHHQNLLSLSYGKVVKKDIKANKGLLPASFDTYQIVQDGIIVFRFTDLQNDKKSLRVGLSKEEGIISPAYVCVKCEDILPEFLYLQLYAYDLRKVFYSMGDGMRQTLSYNDVKEMKIYVPCKEEQQNIIDYFKDLDLKIDLEIKRLKNLKQLKQACLQYLFPNDSNLKPRIRLEGFSGEWLTSNLSQFATKSTEKNGLNLYNETFTNSAEYGVINQRDFFDHDISKESSIQGYYTIHPDYFVYNPRISVLAPVGPINRNKLGRTGVMSPLYFIFKVNGIDKDFLEQYFKTSLWHNYMFLHGNSGARFDRLSITDDKFLQMPILYPEDPDEQKNIAQYLSNIDVKISQQELRVEKLKQIKNTCLDKMFV